MYDYQHQIVEHRPIFLYDNAAQAGTATTSAQTRTHGL
jgi:hypothetical protein